MLSCVSYFVKYYVLLIDAGKLVYMFLKCFFDYSDAWHWILVVVLIEEERRVSNVKFDENLVLLSY